MDPIYERFLAWIHAFKVSGLQDLLLVLCCYSYAPVRSVAFPSTSFSKTPDRTFFQRRWRSRRTSLRPAASGSVRTSSSESREAASPKICSVQKRTKFGKKCVRSFLSFLEVALSIVKKIIYFVLFSKTFHLQDGFIWLFRIRSAPRTHSTLFCSNRLILLNSSDTPKPF